MSAQVIEFNPEPFDSSMTQGEPKILLTEGSLRDYLVAGVISKTAYIFFQLQLKYANRTYPYNVDLNYFSGAISFTADLDDGRQKHLEFTPEDIQIELAKLQKKEALMMKMESVQVSLNFI